VIAQAAAVPAIVAQAAQIAARAQQGIVGFRLHRAFDVHAGPFHRHDDMEFAGVYEDGRLIKVRILHQQIGGQETDDATKSKTEHGYEHPGPNDVFARPYDERHLNDYADDLLPDGTIRFRALVRDPAHGDGTFSVDAAGNVLTVHYTPCVMPPYAHAGTVDQRLAEVLPGYWTLTLEQHHYTGRYFVFSGEATATIDQSRFVRFSDEAAALQALNDGRI
jgi:hypothetical protein